MSDPFLAEIKIVSFNFAPRGWAVCNGQFLPINQNQALFSLLGTTYGGNGQTNFALPNLQGRVPIHVGAGFTQGQSGGEYSHTVNQNEMPAHSHVMNASNASANAAGPAGNLLGTPPTALGNIYTNSLTGAVAMNTAAIGPAGGSQPHTNIQPYLTLLFCIALQGIFPSQN